MPNLKLNPIKGVSIFQLAGLHVTINTHLPGLTGSARALFVLDKILLAEEKLYFKENLTSNLIFANLLTRLEKSFSFSLSSS